LGEVRRILVLNRNHIGDCLLTTPMLRALKRRFPAAHLAVAVPPQNWDLLSENPHVDEIVVRPGIWNWAGKLRFGSQIRSGGYDLIISLQEKSNFYGWATRVATLFNPRHPVTIALDHPNTRRAYQYTSRIRPDQHEVHKYLDLAYQLGCPADRTPVLELEPPEPSRERANRFLRDAGWEEDVRFIGINPGGTRRDKRWPVERFAQVADRLHREMDLPVLLFGGPGDRTLTAEIAARMTHRPVITAGWASLGDTAALLEHCRLLVTGDTGPMHMAVALAVPVVALFGPTSPVKYGPFTSQKVVLRHDVPCEECRLRRSSARSEAKRSRVRDAARAPAEDSPCLHTISTDECVQAALQLYGAPLSRHR
jgi:lipopolysaccharide heptosyltransferase II